MDDRSNEPTATDERVAENAAPAPVAPVTRKPDADVDPATGLPRGMHDDDASPLDRAMSVGPEDRAGAS